MFQVKLAIYPRINEISIMQYLGAADWFIRWPFIFEGIIIGFLGAVSAVIAIYFLYSFVYRQITSFLATMSISFIDPSFILTTMSWNFILIGITLSTIGSVLVVKKFLIIKKRHPTSTRVKNRKNKICFVEIILILFSP